MMSLLLDNEDLEELTGYRRRGNQIAALQQMGIDHYVRPDGKPCVLHSTLRNIVTEEQVIEPDWDAMNA